jgi:two-component sensor histidine kinase
MKYVRKALVFSRSSGNGLRTADLEYNLASHYLDKKMLDSAAHYAESGLAYYRENDEAEGRGRGLLLIGRIHYEKQDYFEAIAVYQNALSQFSPTSFQISRAYQSMGASYMKLGNHQMANEYLLKALDLRRQSGELSQIASTYESLAENSRLSGDFENAYSYLLSFQTYEDSLFSENTSRQMAEIETRYETEKKDQEIMTLEKDREIQRLVADKRKNQIYLSLGGLTIVMLVAGFYFNRSRAKQRANQLLEEKSEKITRQNAEKEILLKEIHHRVKNNLQIISSLLSMQTRTLMDEQAIDAMKESQSRVKTMALIHEKLYQYDNLSRINMKEYISQLSDFLAHTYRTDKRIEMEILTDEITLDIDTAVPLGLIANELLSNALKYAFEEVEEGKISVILERSGNDRYMLEVKDTGKGFKQGTDITKYKSLGLKLVQSLTRQLDGNLVILDQKPGTTFKIDFQEVTLVA